MITEKLYDKDSHIKAFTAAIVKTDLKLFLIKPLSFPRAAASMPIRAKSVKQQ